MGRSCDADCEANLKEEIKRQVYEKLQGMKDPSLDVSCAEAIGVCGDELKCNDLAASEQCVRAENARCSESVLYRKAAQDIKEVCDKEDGCDADCEAGLKKVIKQKSAEAKKKAEEDAKKAEEAIKHMRPPSFGVSPQIVV